MAVAIFTQLTGVWNGRYEAMGDVIAILCFRGLRGLSLRKVSFLTVAIYIAYTADTVFLCKVTIIFFLNFVVFNLFQITRPHNFYKYLIQFIHLKRIVSNKVTF